MSTSVPTERPRPGEGLASRARRAAGAIPDSVLLLALFAFASAVLVHFALQVHTFQPDEAIYVSQGRQLADDFPSALWNTQLFHYGIERLNPLLVALTSSVFTSTPGAMQAEKVVIAAVFASVCIPIYLLARGVGLRGLWVVAAGALAVAVPWTPLATSFLNDPIAYPAFAWAMYACWRAAVTPGWRADLLALVCIGLAALARSNLAVLGAALVIVIVVSDLRFAPRGEKLATAIRLPRRHILVSAAVVVSLLYFVARGHSAVAGVYPVEYTPSVRHLLGQSGAFLGFIAQGLMLVPLIVGSAWALRHLVRPLDRERHALALLTVAASVALLYSLSGGVREERYVFELAPLLTLLTVVAARRRDVPTLAVAATGLAVALLVSGRSPVPSISSAYIPLAYPAQGWWQTVVPGRASLYLPSFLNHHVETLLLIAIPIVVVVAVFLIRRGGRAGLVAAGAVVAVQLLIGLSASAWAVHKYVTGAGDPNGPGFAQRSWADEHLRAGHQIGTFISEPGPTSEINAAELRFWNRRFQGGVLPPAKLVADFDKRTGKLKSRLPRYILISSDRLQRVGLVGKPLAVSTYTPIQLWRTTPETQAAWIFSRGSADGWLAGPQGRIAVRTWTNCVAFTVTAPPDHKAKVRWAGRATRPIQLELAPNAPRVVKTSRPGRAELVAQSQGTLPPNQHVSALITGTTSTGCGA